MIGLSSSGPVYCKVGVNDMTPSLFKMHYTIFLEARKEKKENKNKQKKLLKVM